LVGAGAWVGPNACVRQRVTIGRGALVGMGAVVLKDVEAHTTVAGNPARVINAEEGVRDRM
jgi:acetyltransferase-like isoleucine patch superfamily enzyme